MRYVTEFDIVNQIDWWIRAERGAPHRALLKHSNYYITLLNPKASSGPQ